MSDPADATDEEYAQLCRSRESFAPTQTMVQLRSQYLDEMLCQQIASGCKQVIILGTEFALCPDRLASPNVHYFEVGPAAIIQHKLAQLPSNHNTGNITYIAEDTPQIQLIERLQQHQFDVHLPTYLIWADSVSSLERSDIIAILDSLRNQVHQFHLSFAYLSHQGSDRSTNDPELNQILDGLEQLGIGWITVFKDIATFIRALGLDLLETYTIAQLHDRYCPHSSPPLTLLHCYCVCTIAKSVLNW